MIGLIGVIVLVGMVLVGLALNATFAEKATNTRQPDPRDPETPRIDAADMALIDRLLAGTSADAWPDDDAVEKSTDGDALYSDEGEEFGEGETIGEGEAIDTWAPATGDTMPVTAAAGGFDIEIDLGGPPVTVEAFDSRDEVLALVYDDPADADPDLQISEDASGVTEVTAFGKPVMRLTGIIGKIDLAAGNIVTVNTGQA